MSLLSVNLGGFDTTFAQYIAVTRYEVRKGMLYQLRNWLVQASKHAGWNKNAEIPTNPDYKLVAWLLSSSKFGGRRGGQKKPYRVARTSDGKRISRRATARQVSSGKHRIRMQWYSRKEAAKFVDKHFRMRHRASRWIGAFLHRMNAEIKGQGFREIGVDANQRASRAISAAYEEAAATKDRPTLVSVAASYGYARATTAAKQSNVESANRVERHIMRALNAAKAEIVPNMEQKIQSVLADAARGIRR
jgi:hypothetical protein